MFGLIKNQCFINFDKFINKFSNYKPPELPLLKDIQSNKPNRKEDCLIYHHNIHGFYFTLQSSSNILKKWLLLKKMVWFLLLHQMFT